MGIEKSSHCQLKTSNTWISFVIDNSFWKIEKTKNNHKFCDSCLSKQCFLFSYFSSRKDFLLYFIHSKFTFHKTVNQGSESANIHSQKLVHKYPKVYSHLNHVSDETQNRYHHYLNLESVERKSLKFEVKKNKINKTNQFINGSTFEEYWQQSLPVNKNILIHGTIT